MLRECPILVSVGHSIRSSTNLLGYMPFNMAKSFFGAPQFVKYFGPVLDALHQLGGSGRPDEVRSVIAQKLGLSEQEQSEPLPSKAQPASIIRFTGRAFICRKRAYWMPRSEVYGH
jgi:hypothetical protein